MCPLARSGRPAAGKLIELNDLDLGDETVELAFNGEKYYQVTNEDGSFYFKKHKI